MRRAIFKITNIRKKIYGYTTEFNIINYSVDNVYSTLYAFIKASILYPLNCQFITENEFVSQNQ